MKIYTFSSFFDSLLEGQRRGRPNHRIHTKNCLKHSTGQQEVSKIVRHPVIRPERPPAPEKHHKARHGHPPASAPQGLEGGQLPRKLRVLHAVVLLAWGPGRGVGTDASVVLGMSVGCLVCSTHKEYYLPFTRVLGTRV